MGPGGRDRDVEEETSQRVAYPRGLLQCCLSSDSRVSCSFQKNWGWIWSDKWGTSVNRRERKGSISPSLMWLAWPVGPTTFPWRGKSHFCVALALRAFYALTGVDKCKVQQVHTCTYNWGPGSLSKGAFKWIKPFSCWRLNALWGLWLDNPALRGKKSYK